MNRGKIHSKICLLLQKDTKCYKCSAQINAQGRALGPWKTTHFEILLFASTWPIFLFQKFQTHGSTSGEEAGPAVLGVAHNKYTPHSTQQCTQNTRNKNTHGTHLNWFMPWLAQSSCTTEGVRKEALQLIVLPPPTQLPAKRRGGGRSKEMVRKKLENVHHFYTSH